MIKLPKTITHHPSSGIKNGTNLLSISQAAQALKVSVDTLRRWEQKGYISPVRTPGGFRKYNLEELKQAKQTRLKSGKILSISEAAEEIGVTPATLRRWDSEGTLPSRKTPSGNRIYTLSRLSEFLNSQHQRLTNSIKNYRVTPFFTRTENNPTNAANLQTTTSLVNRIIPSFAILVLSFGLIFFAKFAHDLT